MISSYNIIISVCGILKKGYCSQKSFRLSWHVLFYLPHNESTYCCRFCRPDWGRSPSYTCRCRTLERWHSHAHSHGSPGHSSLFLRRMNLLLMLQYLSSYYNTTTSSNATAIFNMYLLLLEQLLLLLLLLKQVQRLKSMTEKTTIHSSKIKIHSQKDSGKGEDLWTQGREDQVVILSFDLVIRWHPGYTSTFQQLLLWLQKHTSSRKSPPLDFLLTSTRGAKGTFSSCGWRNITGRKSAAEFQYVMFHLLGSPSSINSKYCLKKYSKKIMVMFCFVFMVI